MNHEAHEGHEEERELIGMRKIKLRLHFVLLCVPRGSNIFARREESERLHRRLRR